MERLDYAVRDCRAYLVANYGPAALDRDEIRSQLVEYLYRPSEKTGLNKFDMYVPEKAAPQTFLRGVLDKGKLHVGWQLGKQMYRFSSLDTLAPAPGHGIGKLADEERYEIHLNGPEDGEADTEAAATAELEERDAVAAVDAISARDGHRIDEGRIPTEAFVSVFGVRRMIMSAAVTKIAQVMKEGRRKRTRMARSLARLQLFDK